MKAKMYPKAGLGKVRMPKRFAEGGNPSANEDMPPPKRSPREMAEWQEAIRNAPRNPRRPLTKEELKRQGLDMDKRYAEGGEISDTRKRFNKAFAAARAAGESEFEFEGKRYTTELKKEGTKPRRPPAADRSVPATSSGMSAAYRGSNAMREQERSQSRAAAMGNMARTGGVSREAAAELDEGYSRARRGDAQAEAIAMENWARSQSARGESPRAMRERMREEKEESEREEQLKQAKALEDWAKSVSASKGRKAGGSIKAYAKGGRIDGIASKGKTRGRIF
jgi:hypothetical protein